MAFPKDSESDGGPVQKITLTGNIATVVFTDETGRLSAFSFKVPANLMPEFSDYASRKLNNGSSYTGTPGKESGNFLETYVAKNENGEIFLRTRAFVQNPDAEKNGKYAAYNVGVDWDVGSAGKLSGRIYTAIGNRQILHQIDGGRGLISGTLHAFMAKNSRNSPELANFMPLKPGEEIQEGYAGTKRKREIIRR